MKVKIFFLLSLLGLKNNTQGMDLPLSLKNLETALIQLPKFLTTAKLPQKASESAVTTKFAKLQHDFRGLESFFRELDTPLTNLSALPLENAQFDSSRKPLNDIAKEAWDQIEIIYILNQVQNTFFSSFETELTNIGDNFRENLLTSDEKKNFISILTSQNIKILEDILKKLQTILLALPPTSPINPIINYLTTFTSCLLQHANLAFPRIKELIKNNQKSVENDIKNIKNFQTKIQEIYDQILSFFVQIKKIPLSQQKLDIAINNFRKINAISLGELQCYIITLNLYIPFIKDANLRTRIFKALANIVTRKNFSKNLEKEITTTAVAIPEDIKEKVKFIIKNFKNLESQLEPKM